MSSTRKTFVIWHAVGLALAITLATALVATLVSRAPAAQGVQVADGTSRVEADPNAPDPVVEEESTTLPFNATASSSSSFAKQDTSFSDDGTGIRFDSVHHLSGSDLDFANTMMIRRFTVTTDGLPVAISGLVADSGTGDGGDVLQTVVFRVAGGADVFAFNDQDDDDFSQQGTLSAGTYELEIQGECAAGSGGTCTADIEAHLQLGQSASPDTTITSGPSGTTTSPDATFTYSSSAAGATFECQLDAASFASCPAAGTSFTGLADGAHTFSVRATSGGQTDPTPAIRNWTIDTACPDVEVGFATAQGCFTETESGVFETEQKAWVGGFEIQPRPGGALVLSPGTPAVSASGAGVDMIFAGFAVPIPVSLLPVGVQDGSFEIGTPGTVTSFLKIPVESTVKVAWSGDGRSATYEQQVKVKDLTSGIGDFVTLSAGESVGETTGKLKAKLENGVGFVLQSGEIAINEVNVVPRSLRLPRTLKLKNLLLKFEIRGGQPFWTGQAGIGLPLTRGELTVTGRAFIFNGSLAGGGFDVDGINRQVLGPLFLQKAGGDLLFAPDFGYALRIGATVGPRVQGKKLVSLDGTIQGGGLQSGCANTAQRPDPTKLEAKAKLAPLEGFVDAGIAKVDITERACIYPGTGAAAAAIEGTLEGEITFFNVFGYKGTQTGFISSAGASYEGSVVLRVPGLPDLDGSAIVSTVGVAACTDLGFFEGGFGHRWGGGTPEPFRGCDLGDFRVLAGASSAAPRARAAIAVPAGLPHAGFAATGKSAAPRVRVSGPGGFSVSSPADGSTLRSKRAVIVPVAHERRTYVFVNDPPAGDWQVESLDAANPLTRVSLARGLPDPKVEGRVTKPRKGASRKKFRFHYELRRIPGQRITFTERGAGIARRLGKARGADGTISFKPTIAANRRRTIEAEVVQDGLPREQLTVARFKAPRLPKLRAPEVEANRKRASLTLSWAGVRGAASYVAEVKAGGELLFRVLTKKRRLRFAPTPRRGKLKVAVRALSDSRPPGPTARLTLKAPR